jgi:hypothetical protein
LSGGQQPDLMFQPIDSRTIGRFLKAVKPDEPRTRRYESHIRHLHPTATFPNRLDPPHQVLMQFTALCCH